MIINCRGTSKARELMTLTCDGRAAARCERKSWWVIAFWYNSDVRPSEWYKKSNHSLIASFACSGQRRTITGPEKHLQWYMRYNCLINIIYRLGGGNLGSPFFRSFLGLTSWRHKNFSFSYEKWTFQLQGITTTKKPFDDSRLSPQLPRIKERRRQSSRQSTSFLGVVTFPSFIFVVPFSTKTKFQLSIPARKVETKLLWWTRKEDYGDRDKNMLLTP